MAAIGMIDPLINPVDVVAARENTGRNTALEFF